LSAQTKFFLLTLGRVYGKTEIEEDRDRPMTILKPAAQRPRKERKENAEKRRAQLLDATLRSIVANGLAKTTLATVAAEAGLSQGAAVFYFKSKTGLLVEALREQYQRYEDNWKARLAKAGQDPLDQLMAIIRADFSPIVCNPESLSIWFAFWGEQKFTPQYAEVSTEYDATRAQAIRGICEALFAGQPGKDAAMIAEWIDTLTDGFWQRLHLFPDSISREEAVRATVELVDQLLQAPG
jgi:TetR/AcrR family transcriptional repressor of bet genes